MLILNTWRWTGLIGGSWPANLLPFMFAIRRNHTRIWWLAEAMNGLHHASMHQVLRSCCRISMLYAEHHTDQELATLCKWHDRSNQVGRPLSNLERAESVPVHRRCACCCPADAGRSSHHLTAQPAQHLRLVTTYPRWGGGGRVCLYLSYFEGQRQEAQAYLESCIRPKHFSGVSMNICMQPVGACLQVF